MLRPVSIPACRPPGYRRAGGPHHRHLLSSPRSVIFFFRRFEFRAPVMASLRGKGNPYPRIFGKKVVTTSNIVNPIITQVVTQAVMLYQPEFT